MKVMIKVLSIAALAVVMIQPEAVRAVQALDLTRAAKPAANDVPIGAASDVLEYNPTVAANPVDPQRLVAASQYLPFTEETSGTPSCATFSSVDGGASWSAPILTPMLSADSDCFYPVVAYAPDGSRVYLAYLDARLTHVNYPDLGQFRESFDWDILVRTSDDNGLTWSEVVVALDGDLASFLYDTQINQIIEIDPGFDYLRPWISTPLDSDESNWVYLTATRRDNNFGSAQQCYIDFSSSNDGGATWTAPVTLDETGGFTNCGRFGISPSTGVRVDGSRPAAGMHGNVLVAWYHSGEDRQWQGEFQIRTRYSSDHGATWNEIVVAVTDSEVEYPFGQVDSTFPDVEIDATGGAHIAYTNDPPGWNSNWGDIRYLQSSGVPYDTWSAPVTVNDDEVEHIQSWPALETRLVKGNVYVYLMWVDFRLLPKDQSNWPMYYDIFAAWKRTDSASWSNNYRVTDESSMWSDLPIGEYIDMTANSLFAYGVWTDRRDVTDPLFADNDVYGSWLLPR